MKLARTLLWITAVLLFAGGVLHAMAFTGAVKVLAGVTVPAFYSGSFQALWLIDSAVLVTLAILCVYFALRPASVAGGVLYIVALIPAATAVLICYFVGPFFPVYMLVASAIAIGVAGARWRTT